MAQPTAVTSGDESPWVVRFAPQITAGGAVLDLAAGSGRHTRFLLARGHAVTAVDRDTAGLAPAPRLTVVNADLEDGSPWPLDAQRFAGIVVTNYLHRPLFPQIAAALQPGGVLIYETFALGNEAFGRPRNPDFLLRPGELLAAFPTLQVIAYEHGLIESPQPKVVQRLCAQAAPFALSTVGGV